MRHFLPGTHFLSGRQFLPGRQLLTGVLMVLVGGVHPALAQQTHGWKRQPTPYHGLFQTEDLTAAAKKQREAPAPEPPRVVGGRPVVRLDPCSDPKMFVGRNRPVCRTEKQ